jgi:phosphoglucomutase
LKNHKDQFVLLNGNQTAALLFHYILSQWKERNRITGKEFIVSTIVTTGLLEEIARKFGVGYFECLTGFKYIADVIRRYEGIQTFIVGGEESFGYLVGDFVRDKDAVSACALIAEAAAWMAGQGKSLFDLLTSIYQEFGFYGERLLSVTKKGKTGAEEIQEMMVNYRKDPPAQINGSKVVRIKDNLSLENRDMVTGSMETIDLPESNVLQFFLEDGSRISIRPSGTEPKIKFYFGVREILNSKDEFDGTEASVKKKINDIIASMKLT